MNDHEMGPASGTADAASNSPVWHRSGAAAVCALTFLVYARTLRFQFVHDDRGQIVGNPAVHTWRAVPGYFTSHVWSAVGPTFLSNNYRPLFLLWLRINDAVFGGRAAGWHFTTVAAHVVATYFVMRLAQRILRDGSTALMSGLIFGLHPIHIEGVAWISGVPEPLLAALLIPAYLCWLRWREWSPRRGQWLAASLVLYALALLTKETAVVLLFILFVSALLGGTEATSSQARGLMQATLQSLRALVPFALLTAAYGVARTLALKGFSHPAAPISWITAAFTWPSLLAFYLRLLVLPVRLSPFYDLQFVVRPTLRNTLVPMLVLLLVGGLLLRWGIRSRPAALAIPWLIFPILPVLDIQVFGNGNFAHNRYLYLPSVGFSMLVAAGLRKLKLGKPVFGDVPSSQVWACLGLILLLGFAVQAEDRYYANDAAFYSYAYARLGNNDPVIGMDYANTLAEQGDFERAAGIYRKLIHAHPEMWDAYFNLGYMDYQAGKLDDAVQYLGRAAAGDPAKAAAVFYLGLAEFKLNRLGEAEADLHRAIALAPSAPNYHFALGVVLKVGGQWHEAAQQFNRELELNPRHQAAAQEAADVQRHLAEK